MDNTKKKIFIIATLLIGLIGLVVVLVEVPPLQVIRTFAHAKPIYALLFLASSTMVMLAFSYRWHLILRSRGHKVPVLSLLKYRICGYGVSAMTPTAKVGGEPVRMMLLAKHGVPPLERVSSVLTDKIVEISTNVFFFLIGLTLIIIKFALPVRTEVVILVMMAGLIAIIFLFYYHIFNGKFFFSRIFRMLGLHKVKKFALFEFKIKEMERIMIDYHLRNKRNFYLIILISSLGWIFTLGELYFAVRIIGISQVSITQLFVILVFVGLAFLIPIPLAMGSLEALQISNFALIKLGSSASAVALSFLIRTLDLFWIVLALFFLSSYRMKFLQIFQKSLKTVDEELTEVKIKRAGESIPIRRRVQKMPPQKKPSAVSLWWEARREERKKKEEERQAVLAAKEKKAHMVSNIRRK
jgi:glycosyltransferase 2 family protein